MQKNNKKRHSAWFKAKVALISLNELKTLGQVASMFELNQAQVSKWRLKLRQDAETVFKDWRWLWGKSDPTVKLEKELEEAYKQVGKLKVENDWLKKKSDLFNS
jgi:transposase